MASRVCPKCGEWLLPPHKRTTAHSCKVKFVKAYNPTIEDCLIIALHDAINRPKGVVPESAEPFYDPEFYTTPPG